MNFPPRSDRPHGPFPWLTDERQSGPQFWPVVNPWGLGSLGIFLLGAGALFLFTGIGRGDQEGLITGIILAILPGGAGAVAIVMAVIRWRWFRAVSRARPTSAQKGRGDRTQASSSDRDAGRNLDL